MNARLSAVLLAALLSCTQCSPSATPDSGVGGGSTAQGGGSTAQGGGSTAQGGGNTAQGGGSTGQGGGSTSQGGGGGSAFDSGSLPRLQRPSRSTPVDITTNDELVAMVNQDSDSISFFSTATNTRTASVGLGPDTMPVSVVIHPDNETAFVVLRRSGELVKVTNIDSTPVAATRVLVGSEPTAVALTPVGTIAVVANFNEGTLSFVQTSTMTVIGTTNVGGHPRALAITNDFDEDDLDETVYVTQFFGEAVSEMTDQGRVGKVQVVAVNTRTLLTTISLNPILDTGFGNPLADGGTTAPVACSVNQLYGIALTIGSPARGFVTSVCAAPAGPVFKFTNVFAAISVFDLATNQEDRGPTGSVALSRLIAEQGTPTSSLIGVPIALDFAPLTNVAYVASQAGDVVQRVNYVGPGQPRGPISLGPDVAFDQIDLRGDGGIKLPIGIVIPHVPNNAAYVANLGDRSLSVLTRIIPQRLTLDVNSVPLPDAGSPEARRLEGLKFFFTGTGRWSDRSVNSCGSCHPDGLSDQLTWQFAAGPRQSTPLDGTYARNDPNDQRALNWTGIFDELHDFELNIRGTAGGKGAITTGVPPADVAFPLGAGVSLDGGAMNVTRNDFLSGSTKSVVAVTTLQEWDDVDEYVKSIKSLKAPRSFTALDVISGRQVFEVLECAACHGGPKWSNSRVPYLPSPEKNGSLRGVNMLPMSATGLRTENKSQTLPVLQMMQNTDTLKIDVERGVMLFDGGVGDVGPERITCVLRDVGTFNRASSIERKTDGSQAQGIKGFNPPSLLSLNAGAPFFHNGAARTLEEAFTAAWAVHYSARAGTFLPPFGATTAQEREEVRQLFVFLRSIDETTAPVGIPAGQDICGGY